VEGVEIPRVPCCSHQIFALVDVDVTVHRVDPDLEFVVCSHCNSGWIRDVSAWTRLDESMTRLNVRIDALGVHIKKIVDSTNELAAALLKADT